MSFDPETATRAEVCAAAVADAFADDGEIFASPMGPMPTLGVRLCKLTANPDLVISDGESLFLGGVPPLGSGQEVVEGWIPFRRVFDVVAHGKRHVMMGATQIDRHGNQNISCIGDFARPRRQLLGARGAPGNTVNNRTSYWVPRHSPRVFVDQVDMVCGVGPARAAEAGPAAARFNDIHRVVTNLAVLDVTGEGGTLRLRSVHPGVSSDEVVEATSCDLEVPAEVPQTRLPTSEELVVVREMLDPRKLREREVPEVREQ
jgi:acyl CoA:acetate/3-ketoacid CoA transferase beta subunit